MGKGKIVQDTPISDDDGFEVPGKRERGTTASSFQKMKRIFAEELTKLHSELLSANEESRRTVMAAIADAQVGFNEQVQVLRRELNDDVRRRLDDVENRIAEWPEVVAEARDTVTVATRALEDARVQYEGQLEMLTGQIQAVRDRLYFELELSD